MKGIVSRLVCFIVISVMLTSCGCGPTFLYNWRPKPWTHPLMPNTNTSLDSLINIDGYYLTTEKNDEGREYFYSIMFYDNGLCVAQNTRFMFSEDIKSVLNKIYNKYTYVPYDSYRSWGTYEVHGDTIKAYVIENLIGCDGTRKNVLTMKYLISNDKKLKLISISNPNKEYGYKKNLDVPYSEFHSLENPLTSDKCPYLNKKWFHQSDK